MPWLKVTRAFRDLEAGVHRSPGEVFEASERRARAILAAGVAEVMADPVPAASQTSKRSKAHWKKG